MPSLRLSDADRERLGGPELLPFSLVDITNREAIEIAKLGYNTPRVFRKALFEHDEDDLDLVAWTGAVWLALHRAGIDTDVRTLEFNLDELDYLPDPAPEPEEGGEESGKAPADSANSTRTRSTRGATSRAKSKSPSSRS